MWLEQGLMAGNEALWPVRMSYGQNGGLIAKIDVLMTKRRPCSRKRGLRDETDALGLKRSLMHEIIT